MTTKSLIGDLLAGAAVGVAIGMLLSPQGSATREKLKKGASRLTDAFARSPIAKSMKQVYNEEVDEVANKGKELIESTSQKVKV